MKEAKPSSYRETLRTNNLSIEKPLILTVDRLKNLGRLPTEFPASSGESRIKLRT